MSHKNSVKRALISVSDKSGIVELGKRLTSLGIEIIATGGTLRLLKENGIQVVSVSAFTGSPEILEGRVKTLHPRVHGGILFRRDTSKDIEELESIDAKPIDLVIINLYPFEKTVENPTVTEDEAIENIDIGGPALLRSAAKNHEFVTVICDPEDYNELLAQLAQEHGRTTLEFRRKLAVKAFALTASYDTAIASYFSQQKIAEDASFPKNLTLSYTKRYPLRYGENLHLHAAFYTDSSHSGATLAKAQVLAGKELSYNNLNDLDACLDMLLDFEKPFACVVKHTNPCGAACAQSAAEAYKLAYESDPLSAFGSIIGLNVSIDLACAKLLDETEFVECILAPTYSKEALALLMKKKNRRLLALPEMGNPNASKLHLRFLRGALLAQTPEPVRAAPPELTAVTKRTPTDKERISLLFANRIAAHTKSNAIVIARDESTVGIGMGQTSRVDAAFMAVKRAGERASGAVLASDAFFPMPDGLEVAAKAGVTAVIQPGGSKGDQEVIALADSYGIAMVFTGRRHFKH